MKMVEVAMGLWLLFLKNPLMYLFSTKLVCSTIIYGIVYICKYSPYWIFTILQVSIILCYRWGKKPLPLLISSGVRIRILLCELWLIIRDSLLLLYCQSLGVKDFFFFNVDVPLKASNLIFDTSYLNWIRLSAIGEILKNPGGYGGPLSKGEI